MGLKGISLVFAAIAALSQAQTQEPMVAFKCTKPAMYLTEKGWIPDRETDCIEDPVKILDYCRKKFPDLEVTNIVKSGTKVTINNWCGFDKEKCHKHNSHEVTPYRCLVGAFQSDALLVPEHCLFDHKHGDDCKSETDWNVTAVTACKERDMKMQSFAILQPCGVDMFTGVEFVCCPHTEKIVIATTTEEPKAPVIKIDIEKKPAQPDARKDEQEDFFAHYLQKSYDDRYMNEHQYFEKAKADLQKHHHERVTKMMKEWASARRRVQDMNDVDPKGADKLNTEITARFQKTYEALEQEGLAEKKQLVALHQQRVQAELNDKKRHAMEHYMETLTNPQADAARILKALKHYVKNEQKDRMHTVNHFKHLLDTDNSEAAAVRQQTLDHLHIIDQRIQQAIDMLNRVPNFENKVRTQIDSFLKGFHEIDAAINDILASKVEEPVEKEIMQDKEQKVEESEEHEVVEKPAPELLEDEALDAGDDDYYDDEDEYEDDSWDEYDEDDEDEEEDESEEEAESDVEEETKPEQKVEQPPLHLKPTQYDEAADDDEDQEDEHAAPIKAEPAHMGLNELDVQTIDKKRIETSKTIKRGVYGNYMFGVAVAAIAVFVILVVGIVVLRRKNARQSAASNHGFVEVDQAASPEERHVANMQMNGYENPTYKYFEMNGASNA